MKKSSKYSLIGWISRVVVVLLLYGCVSPQTLRIQVVNTEEIPEEGALVCISDGSKVSARCYFLITYARIREWWSDEPAQQWLNRNNIPLRKIAFTDKSGYAVFKTYRSPFFITAIDSTYSYYWSGFEKTHLFRITVETVLSSECCMKVSKKDAAQRIHWTESSLERNENQREDIDTFLKSYKLHHGLIETNSVQRISSDFAE